MNKTMTLEKAKTKILQFITGLGGLAATLGTLPVDSKDLPMPPEWRPYIISVGFFALTIKSWLPLLGDWIDDGQKNDSFKLPLVGLMCLFFFSSCAGIDTVSISTPWATGSKDAMGNITITPVPQAIVIPAK